MNDLNSHDLIRILYKIKSTGKPLTIKLVESVLRNHFNIGLKEYNMAKKVDKCLSKMAKRLERQMFYGLPSIKLKSIPSDKKTRLRKGFTVLKYTGKRPKKR